MGSGVMCPPETICIRLADIGSLTVALLGMAALFVVIVVGIGFVAGQKP